jgi:molecular chaperone GrpE
MKSINTDSERDAKSTESDPEQALAGDLASLGTELTRQRDLYLRLAADFENFRKRTAQESERRGAAQKEAFMRELLPVIDNLERAVDNANSTPPGQQREGIAMVLEQVHQLLRRHGIESDESRGTFDPHRHEAVAIRHDPARPDQEILETFQRGYRRGEEIFRPAKVVVNDLSHLEEPSHAG